MGLGTAIANCSQAENQNSNPLSASRIYDYKQKYTADKSGEEFNENARVWNVYLDEAESYDMDIIQRYRDIMDSLLVFASLFSAVVTTFVVETSQASQPDNTQILVSILLETNQLLRAAGNSTSINAVPPAALAPGSLTYTSTIDQWVNGLFFTSLALSLSTALLTVLAKQWILSYTSTVSGGARTRALIRHFRFQGLIKWRLGDIIESLPVVLHSSVAVFLIGLALYVSQFSSLICGVVSLITALTFLFYLATSMIPAIFIDCPYRLPFLFPFAQLTVFLFHTVKHAFQFLQQRFWSGHAEASQAHMTWLNISTKSLKDEEHDTVFPHSSDIDKYCSPFGTLNTGQFIRDALNWILNHSSNSSAKEIVFEGIFGLIDKGDAFKSFSATEQKSLSVIEHDLFPPVALFALEKFEELAAPSTRKDVFKERPWFKLMDQIHSICDMQKLSLLNGPLTQKKYWKEQIRIRTKKTLESALLQKDYVLIKSLLCWCQHEISQMKMDQLQTVEHGNEEDISYALGNRLYINWDDGFGVGKTWTSGYKQHQAKPTQAGPSQAWLMA
ncbi:hypothetical protein H2248_001656 [Termitomyces sp. 'cryptogamus']|nr:hypothetical protein H2248_001656 [Termitomyces sp. 'cryptogamus']